MGKAREFQKNIYFCFIDYAKAFDCVDHKKLWKILKEMGRNSLKLTSIESVIPSSHLILCRPLLPHLQAQHQGLFQWMVTIRDEMGAWTRQQPWRGEEIGMCLTGHRGDHIC